MKFIWEILLYIWILDLVKSFQHKNNIMPFMDIYPTTLDLYVRLWCFLIPTLVIIIICKTTNTAHICKFQHFSLTCPVLPQWLQHSCSYFYTWFFVVVVAFGSLLLLLLIDDSLVVNVFAFTNLIVALLVWPSYPSLSFLGLTHICMGFWIPCCLNLYLQNPFYSKFLNQYIFCTFQSNLVHHLHYKIHL